jgi:hypothetical protein
MNYTTDELIEHLKNSYELSKQLKSKLNQDILNMEGMTGINTRHLYNNLCSLNNANYLEIGVWKGSSIISACYKNNINAVAIDDFSESQGTKEIFDENIKKYLDDQDFDFIMKDCFKVNEDELKIKEFDIYMYDGGHESYEQSLALTYYINYMKNSFIFIVDDWNWDRVREGTYDGIEKCNLKIKYKIENYHLNNNDNTEGGYWNGIGMFVLEK